MLGCDQMKDIIKKYFDVESEIIKLDKPNNLPVYLTNKRNFYEITILEFSFIAVELASNDETGISALKKQYGKYSDVYSVPVAFIVNNISANQRNALMRAAIPFIAPPRQIFLPFLGIVLNNRFETKPKKEEYMMPATQSLFLYLLYHNLPEGISKNEAAKCLKCSAMSTSRASDQLVNMGLIREEKIGTAIRMYLSVSKNDAYEKAKGYLINPVQSEIYIFADQLPTEAVKAGESALAEYSMINDPQFPVYAVFKNSTLVKNLDEVSELWSNEKNLVKLQLWKYDPRLFAENNCVDAVSLICSMKDFDDERIEMAIEELEENLKW